MPDKRRTDKGPSVNSHVHPSNAARSARLNRIIAENRERSAEQLRRDGKCRCGVPLKKCAPERCSHEFARDAMWGNS